MTPSKCLVPILFFVASLGCAVSPRSAQAGPLIDWLFGRSPAGPAYPVGQPVPVGNGYATGYAGYAAAPAASYGVANYGTPGNGYAAGYGSYAPNSGGYAGNYGTYYSSQLPTIGPAGAGYTAPMPSGITAATLPATTAPTLSYVPNYQTYSQRAPVTYYRPLMTTDPNTGAQVVAMAPCTSYEVMAQRAPSFGRTALFGTGTAPVLQVPTQALPTYTLPSGGVPLASNASPAFSSPYATGYATRNSGYSPYSAVQPTAPIPGTYPTAPLGQTLYYGSPSGTSSGGSCGGGSFSAAPTNPYVPGLVAPQSPAQPPTSIAPTTSMPGPNPFPSQTFPGAGSGQPLPSNNYIPPSTNPGAVRPPGQVDPGDIPPSLPSFSTSDNRETSGRPRPTLRSIMRTPSSSEPPTSNATSNASVETKSSSGNELPTMMPIPVPQDFKYEPRYNPGLLREEDMTAHKPLRADHLELAGQSKVIQWASFEKAVDVPAPIQQPSRLRPIYPERLERQAGTTQQPAVEPQPVRKSGGWKPSR